MTAGEPLLVLDTLTMRFGGVVAVDRVDLTVHTGDIAGLIGPNGAGKTTIFNVATGVYQATSGQVRFDGTVVHRMRPHQVTRLGLARTFQNIRLFSNMTAVENVMVGADARHRTSVPGAIVGSPRHRSEERQGRELAEELLSFVGIGGTGSELAKNLSYGDQRRLEIARALATDPKLLLLDEPAAGMNPAEKGALQRLLGKIRDTGRTILLIEHDMSVVMRVCDVVTVLDFGRLIAEGRPEQVQRDPAVIEAYLGQADAS